MKMMQLALRSFKASLGRLILTTIAIVAGVGFVAAAFLLSDTVDGMFSRVLERANAEVDGQIMVADLEFGTDVRTIPDTLIAEVEALPEVGRASPSLFPDPTDGEFAIVGDDGSTIKPQGVGSVFAFSWDGEENEDEITIVTGAPPVGIDQVALDSAAAEAAGVSVGDRVTVDTPDGQRDFELAATIDAALNPIGNFVVLVDFESAQILFDREGEVDLIQLYRATGVATDEMIAAVEAVAPPEAAVLSQQQLIEDESATLEVIVEVIRYGFLAFAGIALFVSLFIIYNTFAILVTQRLREIGMLRAIGATKRQIRNSVIFEALVVGLVGSALGLAFAYGATVALMAFAPDGLDANVVLRPRTVVIAMVVGLGATLVSALFPSFLAGRVSPVAAMRNEAPSRTSANRRIVVGAVVLAMGVLLLGLGLFAGGQGTGAILAELGLGAPLTFVGVAMLSSLFAGPFVRVIGHPVVLGASLLALGVALPALNLISGGGTGSLTFVPKMAVSAMAAVVGVSILGTWLRGGRSFGLGGSAAGLAGHIARQNAMRSPRRTASTATALTIGIALVSTVGVVGQSFKEAFADSLDRAVKADLIVYEDSESTFSGEVVDRLEEVDGVAAITPLRFNEVRVGEDVGTVVGYDAGTGSSLFDFDVSEGSTDGLLDGGVLVLASEAEDRSLSVGDTVAVEFPDAVTDQLVVAGIFEEETLENPWVVDVSLYDRHITSDGVDYITLGVDEGAELETVKASVQAVTEQFGSMTVADAGEFANSFASDLDILITLINGLLAFALFIAFLGVVNTIVLSVIERTREIGLLRAVGMTRRQVRGAIRWESVMVCVFGAALGIALGVVFAFAAVTAIPDSTIASVAIPYESVMFVVLVAVLAGVVAAVLPARRAAKMDVLDAIATGG